MTVCTLVVPPGSALAKFAGQRVKIGVVLDVAMTAGLDPDAKQLSYREKCKAYYLKRKVEADKLRLVNGKHAHTRKESAARRRNHEKT